VEYRAVTPLETSDATDTVDPPSAVAPHATTLPSFFNAAKAVRVETMLTTPDVREAATALVSPPPLTLPQAATLPSLFSAAIAPAFLHAMTN
jgi:hypothetical protein